MTDKKFKIKNGLVVGNNVNANVDVHIDSTDAIQLPVGTTGQRPGTGNDGQLRFNDSTSKFEGYSGSGFANLNTPVDGSVVYASLDAGLVEANVAANTADTLPTTVGVKAYYDDPDVVYASLDADLVEANVAANTADTIPTTPAAKTYIDDNAGSAAAFEYISSADLASQSSVSLTGLDDANYVHFYLVGYNIQDNDIASYEMRFDDAASAQFDVVGMHTNATTQSVYSSTTTFTPSLANPLPSNADGEPFHFWLYIYSPATTSNYTAVRGKSSGMADDSPDHYRSTEFAFFRNASEAVSNVTISNDSGSWTSGTIDFYGIRRS